MHALSRSRRLAPAALLAVTLPVLVASLSSARPALADETWAVPGAGLQVTGHGFGHGRGMGQYGAQGAALRGVGYRDVLAHYYPGTAVGPLPAPSALRVLIAEDNDDDLVVRPDAGLALVDADGARWLLPAGPYAWRVTADGYGGQHVDALTGPAWTPWTSPDGRATFSTLRFEGPARVRVDLPGGGGRAFRGTVTAAPAGGRALDTVNTVDAEQYLWGVVPREAISSWLPAALQAQAVAARSYAAALRAASSSRAYDLCDTSACQVYGGSASYDSGLRLSELEPASTTAAVQATAGEIRTIGGKPAFTEFSASTGGWGAPTSTSYLSTGVDPWDDFAGNPVHTWSTTLSPAAIAAAYPGLGTVQRLRVTARDGGGDWGGRVTALVVEGVSGSGAPTSATTSGATFAARLGLRSPWFTAAGAPPAPAPAPLPAIQQHWLDLGGATGPLGAATSDEHDVPGGRAQDFTGGTVYWSPATGAHEVHGAIQARWLAAGGPGGTYGLPTSDELGVPGGRSSTFAGGVAYWSAATGPQLVRGGVLAAYLATGGPAALGLPVDEEQPQAGGVRERFTGGAVYWSPSTGAQPVFGAVLDRYVALGEAAGPLGMPTAPEGDVPGGRGQAFAGGNLYWSAVTGAHEVWGAVLASYLASGGPGGALRLPVDSELPLAGGRRQAFASGAVYWTPDSGAHRVIGGVLDAYGDLGEAASPVGWPVGEEQPAPGGVVQHFTAGDVLWSPATGAHAVYGGVLARYAALGGPGGLLGMPTDGETDAPGGARTQPFARGAVFWSAPTGAHEVHGDILTAYRGLGTTGSSLGAPTSDEHPVPGGARSDFTGGGLVWAATTGQVVQVP